METNDLSKDFWENRYQNNTTGWDLGEASTPIVSYLKQVDNKALKILIPGCGNAHEAEWGIQHGFNNIHVLDFATSAINNFKKRLPQFNTDQLHQEDFFLHEGEYDLIIEQTFFCAIDPSLRRKYALKMHSLLTDHGKLMGVLFNTDFVSGPPFGGNKLEYLNYFSDLFDIKHFDECYNSIKPRANNELFILLEKKAI